MSSFWVADLSARGDLLLSERYTNALLEQVPGAAEIIGNIAGQLYQHPDAFELTLLDEQLFLRWAACSTSSGVLTLSFRATSDATAQTALLAVLLSGIDSDADDAVSIVAQQHLVDLLHDTAYEPGFDLGTLKQRPLIAAIHVALPGDPRQRSVAAVADRCFAAAYFRFLKLT